MKIVKPLALQPGDTIGVVAPASPGTKLRLERGIRYLEKKGFKVVLGENIYQRRGYLAGTDQERADDLNSMFADKKIKAIFCVRGGYGTIRMLNYLDYGLIRRHPKILIGFSDITSLEFALWSKAGLVSYYGPMVAVDFSSTKVNCFTEKNVGEMLLGNCAVPYTMRRVSNWKIYKKGQAQGRLLGGCLSLINPLIGTAYMPDLKGALLFIEDVNEDPYQIDKAFHQWKHAGILENLAGLIIGKMTKCKVRKPPTLTLDQVIRDMVPYIPGPVVANVDFGHTPCKLTMPNGIMGEIDTRTCSLTLLEKPVK
jgi:muramoyltetrapeptide carboxypeptidase